MLPQAASELEDVVFRHDAETINPTTCHYHGRWPAPLPGTLRQVTPGGAYRLRAQGTTTATTTRVTNGGRAAETDVDTLTQPPF